VNPNFTVEAGFMKSIDERSTGGCYVTQLGVDLMIDDGQITSPANWPTTFEVTDKIVTFDGAATGAVSMAGVLETHLKATNATVTAASMSGVSTQGPGGKQVPSPLASDGDWRDLFWVPHTRLNYWDRPIDPLWRTNAVTGRAVLGGGVLSAGIPSDGAAVTGIWEFRRMSDNFTYKQSITDRLHYRTSMSGTAITINLQDAAGTVTKVVVQPIDNRKTVGLILVGRHASQMPINIGDPLEHFCTFYQLLKKESRPTTPEQLVPYFLGIPGAVSGTSGMTGQPTPGYYCPGDWP
jgi:hypothetical protein